MMGSKAQITWIDGVLIAKVGVDESNAMVVRVVMCYTNAAEQLRVRNSVDFKVTHSLD
jgi:hypothetical protein